MNACKGTYRRQKAEDIRVVREYELRNLSTKVGTTNRNIFRTFYVIESFWISCKT